MYWTHGYWEFETSLYISWRAFVIDLITNDKHACMHIHHIAIELAFYPWHSKVLACEMIFFICNVFSHWLLHCSITHWKRALVCNAFSRRMKTCSAIDRKRALVCKVFSLAEALLRHRYKKGPFYYRGMTLFLARISNHTLNEAGYEITK